MSSKQHDAQQAGTGPLARGRVVQAVGRWVPAGLLVMIAAVVIVEALRLGVGSIAEPRPGLWPLVASAMLIVFAALLRGVEVERFVPGEGRNVAAGIGLMLLFVYLFSLWGVLVPAVLTLTAWLLLVARQPLLRSVLIAAGVAAGLHGLFALVLDVV